MKMNDKTSGTADLVLAVPADPTSALVAELEACRDAVKYCFELAMQPDYIPETDRTPRAPWNKARDINDRFSAMDMAIRLMEASGALAESMGKMKSGGELRQSITVERLERFTDAGSGGADARAKNIRQGKGAVPALAGQGEGGGDGS